MLGTLEVVTSQPFQFCGTAALRATEGRSIAARAEDLERVCMMQSTFDQIKHEKERDIYNSECNGMQIKRGWCDFGYCLVVLGRIEKTSFSPTQGQQIYTNG